MELLVRKQAVMGTAAELSPGPQLIEQCSPQLGGSSYLSHPSLETPSKNAQSLVTQITLDPAKLIIHIDHHPRWLKRKPED